MKKIIVSLVSVVVSGVAHAAAVVDVANLPGLITSQAGNGLTLAANQGGTSVRLKLDHVKSQVDTKHGFAHTTYQQTYQGLPVYGQRVVVHKQHVKHGFRVAQPGFQDVNGTVALRISKDKPVAAKLANPQMMAALIKKRFSHSKLGRARNVSATPIYYVDKGKAILAYHVTLSGEFAAAPMQVNMIISHTDHEVLTTWSGIQHSAAKTLQGTGYGGNEKIGRFEYGKSHGYLPVTHAGLTQCSMANADVRLLDLDHKRSPAGIKSLKYTCYPPSYFHDDTKTYGAYSVANDAFYQANVVVRMYRDWYGTKPIPGRINVLIHYDNKYENAHYNAQDDSMNFGDGAGALYPLVSLDITSHEISHGFTLHHSGLRYSGQSGALNESFSDMASKAAQYYESGKVNWGFGGDVVKPGYGFRCADGSRDALRCMDSPHRDRISIESKNDYDKIKYLAKAFAHDEVMKIIDEYQLDIPTWWLVLKPFWLSKEDSDTVDILRAIQEGITQDIIVHFASGVYNKVFYLLATSPGWNVQKAFDVMVYANRYGYWTPRSNFMSAGRGIIKAATALGYDAERVRYVLSRVDIDV